VNPDSQQTLVEVAQLNGPISPLNADGSDLIYAG